MKRILTGGFLYDLVTVDLHRVYGDSQGFRYLLSGLAFGQLFNDLNLAGRDLAWLSFALLGVVHSLVVFRIRVGQKFNDAFTRRRD